jgi:hypothetical protein
MQLGQVKGVGGPVMFLLSASRPPKVVVLNRGSCKYKADGKKVLKKEYGGKKGGLFFDGFFDLCHKVGRNRIDFMNAFGMFSDLFHQLGFGRGSRLEFAVHPDIFACK